MFGGEGDSRALTSKSFLSTKSVLSSTKISSADYDSIATDGTMTYDDAVSKFGKPAQLTVTSMMGSNSSVAIWTNVGSGITSGVSLTLSGDNTVISKVQNGIN